VVRNSLTTGERLMVWEYKGTVWILLRKHLFFGCWFRKRIWREVVRKCLINDPSIMGGSVEMGYNRVEIGKFEGDFCKLLLGAVVYHV
jgi:hypothetical protein